MGATVLFSLGSVCAGESLKRVNWGPRNLQVKLLSMYGRTSEVAFRERKFLRSATVRGACIRTFDIVSKPNSRLVTLLRAVRSSAVGQRSGEALVVASSLRFLWQKAYSNLLSQKSDQAARVS